MTFFYDLNKKLNAIADSAKSQLSEDAYKVDTSPTFGYKTTDPGEHGATMSTPIASKGAMGSMIANKMSTNASTSPSIPMPTATSTSASINLDERGTGDYSAKKARAGKDIGKPGKQFAKIAQSAGERYGSKERGEKVAGAVLAKLRQGAKESVEESDMDESALQAYLGKKKYGAAGMKALQQAGRAGASKEKMARIRSQHDRTDEDLDEMFYYDMPAGKDRGPRDRGTDELARRAEVAKRMKKPLLTDPSYKTKDKFGNLYKIAGPKGVLPEDDLDEVSKGKWLKQKDAKAERLGKKSFNAFGQNFSTDEIAETELDEREFHDKDEFDRRAKVGDTYRGHKGTVTKTRSGETHRRRHEEEPESDHDDDAPKVKGRPKGTGKKIGARGPSGKSKLLTREETKPGKPAPTSPEPEIYSEPDGATAAPAKGTGGKYPTITSGPDKGQRWGDKNPKTGQPAVGPTMKGFKEGADDMHDRGEYDREGEMAKQQLHTIDSASKELHAILNDEENLPEWVQSKITKAMDYLDTARDYMAGRDTEDQEDAEMIPEKAVSKKQQRFMGMVHAAQKGKKPASAAVAKVAREMPKKAAADYAETPHKGLPEKVKPKKTKEESVEETTTAGSVAPNTAEPAKKGKKGMSFGQGIYDSFNREVETLISESMNVSVNISSDGSRSINVSATDDDAEQLAQLLNLAGMDTGHDQHDACPVCNEAPCGCSEQVDENSPDWPTETETSDDALQYSGGLNKPKIDVGGDGQSTVPVAAVRVQEDEDELARLREMAGIVDEGKKNKKPDDDADGIPNWADKNPKQAGGDEDRKVSEAAHSLQREFVNFRL